MSAEEFAEILLKIHGELTDAEREYISRETLKIKSHLERIIAHYEDHVGMQEARDKGTLDSLHRQLFDRLVGSVYHRASRAASSYRRITIIIDKNGGRKLSDYRVEDLTRSRIVYERSLSILETARIALKDNMLKSFYSFYSQESSDLDVWAALRLPEEIGLLAVLYRKELVADNLLEGKRSDSNPGSTDILLRLIAAVCAGFLIGHDLAPPAIQTYSIVGGIGAAAGAFRGLSLDKQISSRRARRDKRTRSLDEYTDKIN
jgi:hypothetical protein